METEVPPTPASPLTIFPAHRKARNARPVQHLGLQHVVLTSVNRDELKLGGADIYAETIRLIHAYVPGCGVEVLTPDFKGYWPALEMVMAAGPEILNHNVESVPR